MTDPAAIAMPERGLCAHRGACRDHPENSIGALRRAVALGVHMVEFDIRLSKDGVPMVFHDSRLDQRTDGRGFVRDHTAAELQRFRLRRTPEADFSDERIPTLAKVLELLPLNIWINIHLKGSGHDTGASWWRRWLKSRGEPLAGPGVAAAIAAAHRRHQAFLTCGLENAAAAKAALPEILICHNRRSLVANAQFLEEASAIGATFVQFGTHRPYTSELIAQVESRGIWTTFACAPDLASARKLLAEGIRFPLVDPIEDVVAHWSELGLPPLKPAHPGEGS